MRIAAAATTNLVHPPALGMEGASAFLGRMNITITTYR